MPIAVPRRLLSHPVVQFLALAGLALAAYGPALGGEFLWDDTDWIRDNETLRSWTGLARIWCEPGAVIQYYPLTYTSWWLDAQLFGLDLTVMHVENVLLHALSALLFGRLLQRLGLPFGFVAALVFLLHPVHVESVAWLVERKNTLSTVLYLLTAHVWLSWLDEPRPRTLVLASTTFALALLAKTATLMLPVVLAAIAIWRHRAADSDTPSTRSVGRGLLPFAALTLGFAALTIVMERGEGAVGHDWALTLPERLALLGQNVAFYAGRLLWPADLAFVYAKWEIGAGTALGWLPTILLLAVLAFGVLAILRGRSRTTLAASLAILTFVANLLPVSGLVDFYYLRYAFAADHFQYLPSLGPIALVACGGLTLFGRTARSRTIATAVALVIVAVLGALTWRRAHLFSNLEQLWHATIAAEPEAWLAHTCLGNLLDTRGAPGDGLEHHRRAVAIYPDAFESNNAVGNHFARNGDFGTARAHFDRALTARPDDPLTFNNLGVMAGIAGEFAAARDWFERGVALAPDNRELLRNLAQVLGQAPDAAVRDGPRAVELARRLNAVPAPELLDEYALFRALLLTDERAEAIALGDRIAARADREGATGIAERVRHQLARLRQ